MLAVRNSVYLFATVVYSVELSLKYTKKARQRLIFPRYIDLNVKQEARLTSQQRKYLRHTPHKHNDRTDGDGKRKQY